MVTHILPGGLRYLTRSQPPGEVHLADADQQLIEADQRDREAGDRAHVLIHQRLDRLETRPEGTTP